MLSAEESLVLVIDIQEKLVAALNKQNIVQNSSKVVNAASILNIPVLFTEQYPQGLGNTVLPLKNVLSSNFNVVEKTYFNVLLEDDMLDKIKAYGKKQIVLMGIEAHICVYQTALALIDEGFDVYVVKDACASREKYEFKMGINAMQDAGAKISCVEMVLFEWLKGSKHPNFKEIQALIK